MSIVELFKKSLDFGIGAAALSAEKLKQFADDMVARGEMTSDDARKFVDDISAKAEEEKRALQEWICEQISKTLQHAGAADADRVERLESRVASLERRVAELNAEMVVRHAADDSGS